MTSYLGIWLFTGPRFFSRIKERGELSCELVRILAACQHHMQLRSRICHNLKHNVFWFGIEVISSFLSLLSLLAYMYMYESSSDWLAADLHASGDDSI